MHDLWCLVSTIFVLQAPGCLGWRRVDVFICLQGPRSNKDNIAKSGYNLGTNVVRRNVRFKDYFYRVYWKWVKIGFLWVLEYPYKPLNESEGYNIGHLFSNFHQIIWHLLRSSLFVLAWAGDTFSIFLPRKLLCPTQMVSELVHINITVTRNFHKSEKVGAVKHGKMDSHTLDMGPMIYKFSPNWMIKYENEWEICDWRTMLADNKNFLTMHPRLQLSPHSDHRNV